MAELTVQRVDVSNEELLGLHDWLARRGVRVSWNVGSVRFEDVPRGVVSDRLGELERQMGPLDGAHVGARLLELSRQVGELGRSDDHRAKLVASMDRELSAQEKAHRIDFARFHERVELLVGRVADLEAFRERVLEREQQHWPGRV